MIATFLASRLAGPVLGILTLLALAGGGFGVIQHFRIQAREAELALRSAEVVAAARANQTQRETIDALKAQHALEITTLKTEAEAATARAAKAEKAKTYVRSAPPSACSDAILDPGFADALRSLRKAGPPAGGGKPSGEAVGP